jgi:hypothetical protein
MNVAGWLTAGVLTISAAAAGSERDPAVHSSAAPAQSPRQAQNAPVSLDYEALRQSRVLDAVHAKGRIDVDGRLDEDDWRDAPVATGFLQRSPNPGEPASERTEARVLFDERNLYVGVICFDSEPQHMIAKDLRKDFGTQESDSVAIFINSLNDNLSGIHVSTNPAGARFDMQSSKDGDESNVDWDGVWDVKVTTSEQGWVAEFVIPFKTLRFNRDGSGEWGFNVLRRVRRRNEESNWTPIPLRYRMARASTAGTLRGVAGVRPGRNLKVKPFVTSMFRDLPSPGAPRRDRDMDGGIDAKYGVTRSLTLDLTYRTDFSQAEVDQQQVNLTRFSLFFPEKREFFLENRGAFTVATAPSGGADSNLIPFFSRRVGLGADGSPIPILGGARMSGKADNYDIGVMTMRTDDTASGPGNTFVVGRVAKHLRRNTWIGALTTSRASSRSGDYNRVYGVDANVRITERLEAASFVYRSDTPGRRGDNNAGLVRVQWKDDDLTARTQYDILQRNFNPEVGFVRRPDTAHTVAGFSWLPRRQRGFVQNFVLGHDFNYYATSAGDIYSRQHSFSTGVDFRNGGYVHLRTDSTFDRLVQPFRLSPQLAIPVGDYEYDVVAVDVSTDKSRVVSGSVQATRGEFWDGDRSSTGGGIDLKPSRHVNMNVTLSRDHITLPRGTFDATLIGTRLLLAFSSRMFLHTFVQYNTSTRQFSSNTRFNLIHRPLSDLFVVYNDRRDTLTNLPLERTLILKFTNLFDF